MSQYVPGYTPTLWADECVACIPPDDETIERVVHRLKIALRESQAGLAFAQAYYGDADEYRVADGEAEEFLAAFAAALSELGYTF